jgi:hypothetical protein
MSMYQGYLWSVADGGEGQRMRPLAEGVSAVPSSSVLRYLQYTCHFPKFIDTSPPISSMRLLPNRQ